MANELEQQKENLDKNIKELQTRIGEQDGRINHLQSSAFQLANFYFVFQGVILTAIASGASALRCSDRWFLFSLSFLAAILNLFSLLVIGLNYNRSLAEKEQSLFECNELLSQLSDLRTNAGAISNQRANRPFGPDPFRKFTRGLCLFLCMSLFVSVAVIMIVACWTILCRRVECKHPVKYVSDKCFRLCDGAKCLSICSEN